MRQLPAFPPALVYTAIGILASIENLFPPIPADTAVALGAFLSNAGTISALSIFGVTWVANVGSAAGVYFAARTLGRKFFTGSIGTRLLKPEALARIERMYERHGTWGIFLSRFIPGARAVIPPFAGVAGLGSVRALGPMIIASGIWYGTLTYIAATLVPRLDDIATLVNRMNTVALSVFLVLAGTIGAALAWRWFRKKKRIGQNGRNE